MTTEDLLKPRYKVIAAFPESPFYIGDIINSERWQEAYNLNDFPAIFKQLHWWHERKKDDLPKYIGYKSEKGVFHWVQPVVRWLGVSLQEQGTCIVSYTDLIGNYAEIDQALYGTTPATLTEYNEYITHSLPNQRTGKTISP